MEDGKILKLPDSRVARDTDSSTDGIKPTLQANSDVFSRDAR
jgi:hypothetical protein